GCWSTVSAWRSGLIRQPRRATGSKARSPFSVPAKAPSVHIALPTGDTQVQWGQLVNFVGSAQDPQAQPIPDTGFVWSNPYRTLGTDRSVSVTDLEVGSYDVTLRVTNAAGLTGVARVAITVGDRVAPLGPRLSALPSPISWTVPAIGAVTQTATLQVKNTGGPGTLGFTAAASPSWLLVNGVASVSLTAPASITVTGDPS